jgi:hypothetical protein
VWICSHSADTNVCQLPVTLFRILEGFGYHSLAISIFTRSSVLTDFCRRKDDPYPYFKCNLLLARLPCFSVRFSLDSALFSALRSASHTCKSSVSLLLSISRPLIWASANRLLSTFWSSNCSCCEQTRRNSHTNTDRRSELESELIAIAYLFHFSQSTSRKSNYIATDYLLT